MRQCEVVGLLLLLCQLVYVSGLSPLNTAEQAVETCAHLPSGSTSGWYYIQLDDALPQIYYCEMEVDGGGWMYVVQIQGGPGANHPRAFDTMKAAAAAGEEVVIYRLSEILDAYWNGTGPWIPGGFPDRAWSYFADRTETDYLKVNIAMNPFEEVRVPLDAREIQFSAHHVRFIDGPSMSELYDPSFSRHTATIGVNTDLAVSECYAISTGGVRYSSWPKESDEQQLGENELTAFMSGDIPWGGNDWEDSVEAYQYVRDTEARGSNRIVNLVEGCVPDGSIAGTAITYEPLFYSLDHDYFPTRGQPAFWTNEEKDTLSIAQVITYLARPRDCGLGYGLSSDTGKCAICPSGTYSYRGLRCDSCGEFEWSQAGSISCTICSAGAYFVDEGCVDCPAGKFREESHPSSECASCVSGTYTSVEGATVCDKCPLGRFSITRGGESTDSCVECPPGRWGEEEGSTSCTLCPENTYSDNLGSTECAQCEGASFSAPGSFRCTGCEPGSIVPDCDACTPGTYAGVGMFECYACEAGTYSGDGASSCTACTPGLYSTVVNATSPMTCSECPSGRYSNQTKATACQMCGLGVFSASLGATTCQLCPKGTYKGVVSESLCISCESGRYSSGEGATGCEACREGQYNDVPGMTTCVECPAGTYNQRASGSSLDACILCPKGLFAANSSSLQCDDCPTGTYSGVTGQSECSPCASGSYGDRPALSACPTCPSRKETTQDGSTSLSQCICARGYFGDDCLDCPLETICASPGTQFPTPLPGYWIDYNADGSVLVMGCVPEVSCKNGQCTSGYAGYSCLNCDHGHYRLHSQCYPCPNSEVDVLYVFGASILAITVLFIAADGFRLRKTPGRVNVSKLATFGIIVNHLQITALFSKLLVPWPAVVLTMFDFMDFLNFNVELARPECSGYSTLSWKMNVVVGIPVAITVTIVLYTIIESLVLHRKFEMSAWELFSIRSVYRLSMFFVLIYIQVTSRSMSFFDCSANGDGKLYLDSDPSVQCFSDEWMAALPAAMLGVVIYVVGAPVFILVSLLRIKHSLHSHKSQWMIGILYLKFEVSCYYWEMISMLKKFLWCATILYQSRDPSKQAVTMIFIIFVFHSLHMYFRPYVNILNDLIEGTALVIQFATILAALTLGSVALDEQEADVIGLMIVVANCISLLLMVSAGIVLVYRMMKGTRKYHVAVEMYAQAASRQAKRRVREQLHKTDVVKQGDWDDVVKKADMDHVHLVALLPVKGYVDVSQPSAHKEYDDLSPDTGEVHHTNVLTGVESTCSPANDVANNDDSDNSIKFGSSQLDVDRAEIGKIEDAKLENNNMKATLAEIQNKRITRLLETVEEDMRASGWVTRTLSPSDIALALDAEHVPEDEWDKFVENHLKQ